MTFIHASLLAGMALIALPIILHLMMRRKPTHLEFPALRFIQKKHDANRRRLNLRHWLLLLLRIGLIALLAFALARPSVKLGIVGGSQEAPVAAAMVFDAAPHMAYRHENRTRLEVAQDFGQWLLRQLPEESEIAVIDTRGGALPAFQPDRGAAKDRIGHLEIVANAQPLPTVLSAACKLLVQSKLERKELYIFTDLARSAWPDERIAELRRKIGELGVGVFVIDVGVLHPVDCSIAGLKLSGETLPNHSSLSIEARVACVGEAATRSVEMFQLDANRKPVRCGVQTVEAKPGEQRPVEFHLSDLTVGVHQGYLRLTGQDGLPAGDAQFFTVEVQPAWRVLMAAPKPPKEYGLFLSEALAPAAFRRQGRARFACDFCDIAELGKQNLTNYAGVCLLDPTPMAPAVWQKLADYAADGHGVAVFLGRNAAPIDTFNEPEAQRLLPGKLVRQVHRPDGDLWLAPNDYQHPILSVFRDRAGSIPWDAFPVFRYWQFSDVKKGVGSLFAYNDRQPAMFEQPIGKGRVITMTTPVSDRPNRQPWNLLPIDECWPFLILMNQTATYLVGGNDAVWNYLAGQTVILRLDETSRRQSYMLYSPDGLTLPYPADLNRRDLIVTATEHVGNYRLRSGGAGGVDLGFSVNYAPEMVQLDRMSDVELSALLNPVKFQIARTRDQIDRDISTGRVGRELFPSLIVMVALLLALEMLVSNRFYKE
jgi:hypothetical protein